jgi:hypothetical protein
VSMRSVVVSVQCKSLSGLVGRQWFQSQDGALSLLVCGLSLHLVSSGARISSALSKPDSPEVTVSGSDFCLGDGSGIGSSLGAENV